MAEVNENKNENKNDKKGNGFFSVLSLLVFFTRWSCCSYLLDLRFSNFIVN